MSSYFVSKSKDTSWATWVGTNKCHLKAHVNLQVRASFILRCGCKEHTLWNISSPLHKLHWREIGSHISESSARMPKVFLSPSSWCQYYAHCLLGHTILCYSRELACGFQDNILYFIAAQFQKWGVVLWKIVLEQSRWRNPGNSESVQQINACSNKRWLKQLEDSLHVLNV
jgi:hypothetical protein